MMYKPSIGIVCLAGKVGKAETILPWWKNILEDDTVDFVFMETGTDEKHAAENRHICLNKNVKRHWIPYAGKETRCFGRNYGAANVNGEYLWFVDGDCKPHYSAIPVLRAHLTQNVMVSTRILFQQKKELWDDHRLPHMDAPVTIMHNPWFVAEGSVALSRRLFNYVGKWQAGWAKNGYCAEGAHLYWRCLLARFTPLLLLRETWVTHQWHAPTEERLAAHENRPLLKQELEREAERYGLLSHPMVNYILDSFQGDMLDGR